MAVAVKDTMETGSSKLFERLAIESWAGTAYILGSLAAVFYVLPRLWEVLGLGESAVSMALLLVLMVLAGAGLVVLGARLAGAKPQAGLRSGVFFGVAGMLLAAWVTSILGGLLETSLGPGNRMVGIGVTVASGAALLVLLGWLYSRPWFEAWLVQVEEQGWFHTQAYKKNQGLRMRRGTMLGILILVGCGIYSLLAHHSLETGPSSWTLAVPFAGNRAIVVLPNVRFTLPFVLAAAGLWLAYRVVNLPVFADFLIATEAEVNKVSWTTRKKLVQDTIVVLVTVALLTGFLFVVDQVWGQILKGIGVLQLEQPVTYQLTESSMDGLRAEAVPEEILKKLKVQGRSFASEKDFLDDVSLAPEEKEQYQTQLLRHARQQKKTAKEPSW